MKRDAAPKKPDRDWPFMEGTRDAEVIQVIRTVSLIGTGTPSDPMDERVDYWSLDGSYLATEPAL